MREILFHLATKKSFRWPNRHDFVLAAVLVVRLG